MKIIIWLLVITLVILHQDCWNWDDDRLVFGFFPYTLLYHVCISLAASATWFLAVIFAWPSELEVEED